MGAWFLPTFEGELDTPEGAEEALARVTSALEERRLFPFTGPRWRYEIVESNRNRLRFRAANLATEIAIGLNDVSVETHGGRALRYSVSCFKWILYVAALAGGIMAFQGALFLALPPLRNSMMGGNPGAPVWLLAVSLFFFLVVFSMIMLLVHRPMAQRMLEARLRAVIAGTDPDASPEGRFMTNNGYRYRSGAAVWGLPLVSVAVGPKDGSLRGVAKGVIAIGDAAVGVVAVGGAAFGVVAVGGLSVGALAVGGAALGLAAFGGLAVGLVAFGGLAVGIGAVGGLAIGISTFSPGP